MNDLTFDVINLLGDSQANKTTIKECTQELGYLAACGSLSKSEFILDSFLPAIQQLHTGYNQDCVNYAAKVLARFTQS